MTSNTNIFKAITGGVCVALAVSLLSLFVALILWPNLAGWVWLVLSLTGSAVGGATAAWLAQTNNLRSGLMVGLIVGGMALAAAVVVSDLAPRVSLIALGYLVAGTAIAMLSAALVKQHWTRRDRRRDIGAPGFILLALFSFLAIPTQPILAQTTGKGNAPFSAPARQPNLSPGRPLCSWLSKGNWTSTPTSTTTWTLPSPPPLASQSPWPI